RLIIVGDGPERQKLECLAHELSIADRVCFTGHVDRPWEVYRGFDVFALSSDTEQMPLSVIEAMASGLPAAATLVGDVVNMLAAENRAYVRPPEVVALADALLTLIADPTLRQRLGRANRAKAETEFGQPAMVAGWEAALDGKSI